MYFLADYVAWKGRFCAFDYSSFEKFMTYIFAQVMNRVPPVPDPWDTNITIDALGMFVVLWNGKERNCSLGSLTQEYPVIVCVLFHAALNTGKRHNNSCDL